MSDLPAAEGFVPVMAPYVRSEVADPGLAGWPTLVGAEVGNRVIKIDPAAHCGGIREHVGGIAELQLFAEPRGDFVAVDGGMSGG